jgi:hypothetical protein
MVARRSGRSISPRLSITGVSIDSLRFSIEQAGPANTVEPGGTPPPSARLGDLGFLWRLEGWKKNKGLKISPKAPILGEGI